MKSKCVWKMAGRTIELRSIWVVHTTPSKIKSEVKREIVLFVQRKERTVQSGRRRAGIPWTPLNCRRINCCLKMARFPAYVASKVFSDEKWSLDAAFGAALHSGEFRRDEMVCTKTLYNYVDLGLRSIKILIILNSFDVTPRRKNPVKTNEISAQASMNVRKLWKCVQNSYFEKRISLLAKKMKANLAFWRWLNAWCECLFGSKQKSHSRSPPDCTENSHWIFWRTEERGLQDHPPATTVRSLPIWPHMRTIYWMCISRIRIPHGKKAQTSATTKCFGVSCQMVRASLITLPMIFAFLPTASTAC